jgi:hypothetical protein
MKILEDYYKQFGMTLETAVKSDATNIGQNNVEKSWANKPNNGQSSEKTKASKLDGPGGYVMYQLGGRSLPGQEPGWNTPNQEAIEVPNLGFPTNPNTNIYDIAKKLAGALNSGFDAISNDEGVFHATKPYGPGDTIGDGFGNNTFNYKGTRGRVTWDKPNDTTLYDSKQNEYIPQ